MQVFLATALIPFGLGVPVTNVSAQNLSSTQISFRAGKKCNSQQCYVTQLNIRGRNQRGDTVTWYSGVFNYQTQRDRADWWWVRDRDVTLNFTLQSPFFDGGKPFKRSCTVKPPKNDNRRWLAVTYDGNNKCSVFYY